MSRRSKNRRPGIELPVDRDVARELDFHIAMATEELVEEGLA